MSTSRLFFCLSLFVLIGAPNIAAADSVSATAAQELKLREGDIAEITSIWSGFLAAAQAGDIESALEFFNPIERARQKRIFDSMGSFFSNFGNDMAASEFIPIEISDEVAELTVFSTSFRFDNYTARATANALTLPAPACFTTRATCCIVTPVVMTSSMISTCRYGSALRATNADLRFLALSFAFSPD